MEVVSRLACPSTSWTTRSLVIPDAWFQLAVAKDSPVSIALELDRSTHGQQAWRLKVAALALWAAGPYQKAFETDNVTIAVVCPDKERRERLRSWTAGELASRQLESLADRFLFTAVSPVTTDPAVFFFARLWRSAGDNRMLSLLDAPK
jgi:hypothetical protein